MGKEKQTIKLEVTDEDVMEYIQSIQSDQATIDRLNSFIFRYTTKYKEYKQKEKYNGTLFGNK